MSKNTLSKTDLVDVIHAKNPSFHKKDVAALVDSFLHSVTETIAQGDDISILGFGKFQAVTRAARTGRNPATGEEMQIAESTVPKFTPGKAFKDAVSKK